jgi:hypothetical protein
MDPNLKPSPDGLYHVSRARLTREAREDLDRAESFDRLQRERGRVIQGTRRASSLRREDGRRFVSAPSVRIAADEASG